MKSANDYTRNAFFKASSEGDVAYLRSMIGREEAALKADYGCAIRLASRDGQLDVVKLLVSTRGWKVSDYDEAIRLASLGGHAEIVKFLSTLIGPTGNAGAIIHAARYGDMKVDDFLSADIMNKKDARTQLKDVLDFSPHIVELVNSVPATGKRANTTLVSIRPGRYYYNLVERLLNVMGYNTTRKEDASLLVGWESWTEYAAIVNGNVVFPECVHARMEYILGQADLKKNGNLDGTECGAHVFYFDKLPGYIDHTCFWILKQMGYKTNAGPSAFNVEVEYNRKYPAYERGCPKLPATIEKPTMPDPGLRRVAIDIMNREKTGATSAYVPLSDTPGTQGYEHYIRACTIYQGLLKDEKLMSDA